MVQTLSDPVREAFASPDRVLLKRSGLSPVACGDFDRLSRLAHAISARGVDPEGVAETAAIRIPHPDFGERVMAASVPQPGAALGEAQILDRIRDHLAKYQQPKRIVIVPELPRNTMGKVQKHVLREQDRGMFASQH